MLKQHGHLSFAGHTQVDGQPAILLRDAGDGPGNQPETMAVAASGTPYPLRVTASGNQNPGGPTTGPCANGSGPTSVGSVTLSGFGQLGKLQVPTHAISLKALEQLSTQSSTSA
jgi:hypothetical protein